MLDVMLDLKDTVECALVKEGYEVLEASEPDTFMVFSADGHKFTIHFEEKN